VHCFCDKLLILYPHPMPTLSAYRLVLCDTHDTSILTVDTYLTIPVSPRSRYTAVYRRTNNYGETTQLHASIVSIADAVQLFPIYMFKTSKFKVQTSHDYVILLHYSVANDDVMFTLLNCRYILNFSFFSILLNYCDYFLVAVHIKLPIANS